MGACPNESAEPPEYRGFNPSAVKPEKSVWTLQRWLDALQDDVDRPEDVEQVHLRVAVDVAENRLIGGRHLPLQQHVDHLDDVEEIRRAAVVLTVAELATRAAETQVARGAGGQSRLATGLVRIDDAVAA